MSEKQAALLEDISKEEKRTISKQIVHMLDFYLQHKKSFEKDIGDLTELSYDLG